jgi:VanZ family protein
MRRALIAWAPVLLWAALIFGLSSVPDLGTGLGGWDLLLRKLAHVTEYAVLGLLLLRATGRELPALLAGVAYATTDEIHQTFVTGRHGVWYDVLVDGIGIAIGIYGLGRLTLGRLA